LCYRFDGDDSSDASDATEIKSLPESSSQSRKSASLEKRSVEREQSQESEARLSRQDDIGSSQRIKEVATNRQNDIPVSMARPLQSAQGVDREIENAAVPGTSASDVLSKRDERLIEGFDEISRSVRSRTEAARSRHEYKTTQGVSEAARFETNPAEQSSRGAEKLSSNKDEEGLRMRSSGELGRREVLQSSERDRQPETTRGPEDQTEEQLLSKKLKHGDRNRSIKKVSNRINLKEYRYHYFWFSYT
jgi:hypothetical protein